jgi:two-component system chemotaxis response regulator CheB
MEQVTSIAARSRGVLIVDDDAVYRRGLQTLVTALTGLHVVAAVRDLRAAKRVIAQGEVSIVTLDVVLDAESGLDLLRWLGSEYPDIRVVLVTAGRDAAARTEIDAIFLGAAALVRKPEHAVARREFERTLRQTLLDLIGRYDPQLPGPVYSGPLAPEFREVIAVGASTGGPPVVLNFLSRLAPDFDVPILLVQHMPQGHIPYYVEHLAARSGRPVLLGTNAEVIERGRVYVAPGGSHMQVVRVGAKLVIRLDDGLEEHYCRPAVDPLFRSVAAACGSHSVGVVMTGMGSDGALGATLLRKVGAPVVVQDRNSSVVWGMPGAVVQAGAACMAVPAAELASVVMRWSWTHKRDSGRGRS